jgi:hypothetical protein
MELVWQISGADIDRLRTFLSTAAKDPLVEARVATNLATTKAMLSRAGFWHALVGCLLTTQQKSGPDGAVARFMRARPFPLSYRLCCSQSAAGSFVTTTLANFGGIRRSTRIGNELGANLGTLEDGRWDEVLERENSLLPDATQAQESEDAEYVDDLLKGLGPKQSRNLLQGIGFTRYEIGWPIIFAATLGSTTNMESLAGDGAQLRSGDRLCAENATRNSGPGPFRRRCSPGGIPRRRPLAAASD